MNIPLKFKHWLARSISRSPSAGYLAYNYCLPSGAQLHLVGSVHMASPYLSPLPSLLLQRLASADALIVENDLLNDNTTDDNTLPDDAPRARLAERLTPSDFTLLLQCCQAIELPLARVDHLPAWQVTLTLQAYLALQLGLSSEYGIDYQLLLAAYQQQLPIIELEKSAQKNALLQQLPQDDMSLLHAFLTEWQQVEQILPQLEQWWLSGKPPDRLFLPAPLYNLYSSLLLDRHSIWIEQLQQLPSGNYLLVVDVLHLSLGAKSFPAALMECCL